MLNEELIKQAAFDVQHKIVDLSEYKLSVSSKESNESQDFSWIVELAEPSMSIYPLRFIRVILILEGKDKNISHVSFDYGLTIQKAFNCSVDEVLKKNTFDNYAESAMKNVSFMFQDFNIEQTNVLTSLAYEFTSKLIQTLSKSNHPEV